jgi:glycosyltransferase involved in cell wall biosynthesis
MKKVAFSIIITTLNEEMFLPRLLDDLKNQTFDNFEVIIVDGKSADKTFDIARSFKESLINVGIVISGKREFCYQRNLGARYANSYWLIFMDADNRVPRNFVEQIHNHLENTSPDLFTCCPEILSKYFDERLSEVVLNFGLHFMKKLGYPFLLGSMIGIKKHVFEDVGGFNEKIHYAEDTDLSKRIRKRGYSYEVFSNPKYKYDFRRLRKVGLLGMIFTYLKLRYRQIFGIPLDFDQEYPMGGTT